MKEGVVSTPDGIYINKNTKNPEDSEIFVDFMTSYDTQNVISGNLGRRSVRIISKLLLQPILENAVKYGFGEKEKLTVRVTGYQIQEYNTKNKKIYKVGDTVYLTFEDNTLYAL